MSTIAYWKIRARLLGVPGVANVAIWGEQLQQLQVQVDPEKLLANHVSLDQVMKATADALDAGLLRYSEGGSSAPAGSSTPPTRSSTSATCSPSSRRRTWPTVPIGGATRPTAHRCARRRGRRGDRPPAAHRRRRHQRRPGPAAHRREAAVGQHARSDEGSRSGDRRTCSRDCRASTIDTHDLPAGHLHRAVDRQPQPRRCSSARSSCVIVLTLFLF